MSRSGSASAAALVVGLAVALAGCGDGLVDGTYEGEPVFTMSGVVRYEAEDIVPDESLYVTVVWEPPDEGGYEYVPALEVETTFPARYTLSVYAPPPDSVLWPQGEGKMGVGVPLLYADVDGDTLLAPGVDHPVGGAGDVYLLYLTAPLAQPAAPDGEAPPELEAGFHAVQMDGGCPGEGRMTPADPSDIDLTIVDDDPLGDCSRE